MKICCRAILGFSPSATSVPSVGHRDARSVLKKRHAQSCVVSVIFPSGERWVIVKWLYKCTNGCRILFDNWMLLSCEETACEPVTRCYKTGMIWDVTTRGFHGSTGWQSVFAKWQFDAIWFSKGTSATLRRCYCKLRVNLGKFNAAKRLGASQSVIAIATARQLPFGTSPVFLPGILRPRYQSTALLAVLSVRDEKLGQCLGQAVTKKETVTCGECWFLIVGRMFIMVIIRNLVELRLLWLTIYIYYFFIYLIFIYLFIRLFIYLFICLFIFLCIGILSANSKLSKQWRGLPTDH